MSFPNLTAYDVRYLTSRARWSEAYAAMADTFFARFGPCRAVDVGCAAGHLVEALRERGFEAFGVDGAPDAPSLWSPSHLDYYRQVDVTAPTATLPSAELVCCMEVAEHLPEAAAETLVKLLVAHAPRWVVFTAAPPGAAADPTHLNEQPYSWWIDRFARVGYRLDRTLSCSIRVSLRRHGSVPFWYIRNLLTFTPVGSAGWRDSEDWIHTEQRFLEMDMLHLAVLRQIELSDVEHHLGHLLELLDEA